MNKFNPLFFVFLRTSFAEREKRFRDSWKKTHEIFFLENFSYSSYSSLMMIPVDFGLDMADGVGIMRRSCCGPKEVWEISLSGGGWWFSWQR